MKEGTMTTEPTVSEIREVISEASPHMQALQQLQAAYDQEGWRIGPPRQPIPYKIRHMNYHLRAASTKIDRKVEQWEHDEFDGPGLISDQQAASEIGELADVAADLLFTALQLAEIGGFDLTETLADLWGQNAARFTPDSSFAALNSSEALTA